MKKRRKARVLALQGLYAWELSGNSIERIIGDFTEQSESDEEVTAFASRLLRKASTEKETLDQDISAVVKNWEFGRIAIVDRLILRLALCELLHFDEIPPKVTINEAIDLAKEFSTNQSGRFVNGILDSLYQKCKTEQRITKRGRGLIE